MCDAGLQLFSWVVWYSLKWDFEDFCSQFTLEELGLGCFIPLHPHIFKTWRLLPPHFPPVWKWQYQITKSTFKGNSLLSKATRTSPDLGQNDLQLKIAIPAWDNSSLLIFWGTIELNCKYKFSLCLIFFIYLFPLLLGFVQLPLRHQDSFVISMPTRQRMVWNNKRQNSSVLSCGRSRQDKSRSILRYLPAALCPRSAYNNHKRGKFSEDPLPSVTETVE